MALTKINTKLIANNTIALTNIADNAVDATKIASNSILTRHIDDDQITADQIVDDIALAGNISTTGNFGVGAAPTNGGISTAASPVLSISGTVPELNFVDTSTSANDYWIRVSDGLQFGEASDSRMYLKNGGNLGIGTTSPDQLLHVHAGTAGSVSANSNADLVIEDNDHAFLQFLTPADKVAGFYFGDADDNDVGSMFYDHNTNHVELNISGTQVMNIDADGPKFSIGGNDLYLDLFSDSGSNQGSGSIRFYTDGSSANQNLATILMQQESGGGSAQKAEMYFKVSDNGSPSTALKILNNKNIYAYGGVYSYYDGDNHVTIRGLSNAQYIQYSSARPLKFVSIDTFPNSGATINGQITGGIMNTYNGFSVRRNSSTDLSGADHLDVGVKMAIYQKTISATDVSNGYVDVEHKVYRDNYIGHVVSIFDVSANVVYSDFGASEWATYARRYASGDITRVGFGNGVVSGDKVKMCVFWHGGYG